MICCCALFMRIPPVVVGYDRAAAGQTDARQPSSHAGLDGWHMLSGRGGGARPVAAAPRIRKQAGQGVAMPGNAVNDSLPEEVREIMRFHATVEVVLAVGRARLGHTAVRGVSVPRAQAASP